MEMAVYSTSQERGSVQKRSRPHLLSSHTGSSTVTVTQVKTTRHKEGLSRFHHEDCCQEEGFDLSPKTDYTYAHTGSYSASHSNYPWVHPNLSRRRLGLAGWVGSSDHQEQEYHSHELAPLDPPAPLDPADAADVRHIDQYPQRSHLLFLYWGFLSQVTSAVTYIVWLPLNLLKGLVFFTAHSLDLLTSRLKQDGVWVSDSLVSVFSSKGLVWLWDTVSSTFTRLLRVLGSGDSSAVSGRPLLRLLSAVYSGLARGVSWLCRPLLWLLTAVYSGLVDSVCWLWSAMRGAAGSWSVSQQQSSADTSVVHRLRSRDILAKKAAQASSAARESEDSLDYHHVDSDEELSYEATSGVRQTAWAEDYREDSGGGLFLSMSSALSWLGGKVLSAVWLLLYFLWNILNGRYLLRGLKALFRAVTGGLFWLGSSVVSFISALFASSRRSSSTSSYVTEHTMKEADMSSTTSDKSVKMAMYDGERSSKVRERSSRAGGLSSKRGVASEEVGYLSSEEYHSSRGREEWSRCCCCLCLPLLLLLLPLLLAAGGHYVSHLSRAASFFTLIQQNNTHHYQVPVVPSVDVRREVEELVAQRLQGSGDWMTRPQVEALLHTMLTDSSHSLRHDILHIIQQGTDKQASLRTDQDDMKARLLNIDGQMKDLMTKIKGLEGDIADSSSQFMGALKRDGEQESGRLAGAEQQLAELRAEMETLQSKHAALLADLKTCCHSNETLAAAITTHLHTLLPKMFGGEGGSGPGQEAMSGWLQERYVNRDELDRHLSHLTADITGRINAAVEESKASQGSTDALSGTAAMAAIDEETVRAIVEAALLKYSADRTGLPDYALESSGGSVVSVRCSETFYRKTALLTVLGIPLWYSSNSPRTVIQPGVQPGECWAFKGQSGHLVVQLSMAIQPTAFTLEHIPRALSTTGNIHTAPRDFAVIGLSSETDTQGISLGNFTYHAEGSPIQSFNVQRENAGIFRFIELHVLNNHGSQDFTCLYRFRVHGIPHSQP